jgi:hypothetical protein
MNQISIPDTFTLQDRNIKKQPMYKDNKEGAKKEEPENKLPIVFSFKSPVKEFTFQVMMQNKHLTDIRIFKITITVLPRPIKANLELTVSLGDEIRQDIPLINVTDKDVNFKV